MVFANLKCDFLLSYHTSLLVRLLFNEEKVKNFIEIRTAPFALVLYGVGIQHGLHWICPAVAFGLFNFSTVVATNIVLMYAIDVCMLIPFYMPVAPFDKWQFRQTNCRRSCRGSGGIQRHYWFRSVIWNESLGRLAGISKW